MTEAFLQYIWHHQMTEGNLLTTDGLPVSVERPGMHNLDAGPDFTDARIVIDGVRWVGNVEVHMRASDWNRHGHNGDDAYNNVILHVVYIPDTDIFVDGGRRLPVLDLSQFIPLQVWNQYEELMSPREQDVIPCANRIGEIPEFIVQMSQDRMVVERMQRKSDDVRRLLAESKGNWEQACYWIVARYFGGKTNALPFELLAKITPLSLIAKIRDNRFRVEALLYGQAGLLTDDLIDDYAVDLRREYEYLRAAYKLHSMQPHMWKFFRLYPVSFPTVRISQLAEMLTGTDHIFSRLRSAADVKELRAIFDLRASNYWDDHFSFDFPAPHQSKRMGRSYADHLIINAWVPLLCLYAESHGDDNSREQALSLLQQLPAEDNVIVRRWKAAGVKPRNAAESQALIQRYNEYCSRRDCLKCSLAFRLLKPDSKKT